MVGGYQIWILIHLAHKNCSLEVSLPALVEEVALGWIQKQLWLSKVPYHLHVQISQHLEEVEGQRIWVEVGLLEEMAHEGV